MPRYVSRRLTESDRAQYCQAYVIVSYGAHWRQTRHFPQPFCTPCRAAIRERLHPASQRAPVLTAMPHGWTPTRQRCPAHLIRSCALDGKVFCSASSRIRGSAAFHTRGFCLCCTSAHVSSAPHPLCATPMNTPVGNERVPLASYWPLCTRQSPTLT